MERLPAMDVAAALERFDGDRELLLTLAQMFLERAVGAACSIREALESQDYPALAKAAHKLKGSALEFCAHPLTAAAAQLETSAQAAVPADLAQLCERLTMEMQRLTGELIVLVEESAGA